MHCVEEGASGERLAYVTWMESLVRDLGQREVLYDLAIAAEHVHKLDTQREAFMMLEKARFNLLRMWAET
ncbi:MAG: hypothetical protein CMM46_11480 [Rhodospirillaceae bacterium]|nr:hypothetical protein [Rhodospirillaceae bacterium]